MTIAAKARAKFSQSRSSLISVGIHVVVVLGLLGVVDRASKIAPYKLPGTAQGVRLLTFYSPGSPEHPISDIPMKTAVPQVSPPAHSITAPSTQKEAGAPPADIGK